MVNSFFQIKQKGHFKLWICVLFCKYDYQSEHIFVKTAFIIIHCNLSTFTIRFTQFCFLLEEGRRGLKLNERGYVYFDE